MKIRSPMAIAHGAYTMPFHEVQAGVQVEESTQ